MTHIIVLFSAEKIFKIKQTSQPWLRGNYFSEVVVLTTYEYGWAFKGLDPTRWQRVQDGLGPDPNPNLKGP